MKRIQCPSCKHPNFALTFKADEKNGNRLVADCTRCAKGVSFAVGHQPYMGQPRQYNKEE
jgi:RNase P subunit RPR2